MSGMEEGVYPDDIDLQLVDQQQEDSASGIGTGQVKEAEKVPVLDVNKVDKRRDKLQWSSKTETYRTAFSSKFRPPRSFLEACVRCNPKGLRMLIQQGPSEEDVNQIDKTGKTGLAHACAQGSMSILQVLVHAQNVNVNLADNEGNTPLIFASQAGHLDVLVFLLLNFPDVAVDQPNLAGMTPLMKAAINGRLECAKVLVLAGASTDKRDWGRGMCAEEWARYCGRGDCAEVIRRTRNNPSPFHLNLPRSNSEPHIADTGKHSKQYEDNNNVNNTKTRWAQEGNWFQAGLRKIRRKFKSETTLKDFIQKKEDSACQYLVLVTRCSAATLLQESMPGRAVKFPAERPRPAHPGSIRLTEVSVESDSSSIDTSSTTSSETGSAAGSLKDNDLAELSKKKKKGKKKSHAPKVRVIKAPTDPTELERKLDRYRTRHPPDMGALSPPPRRKHSTRAPKVPNNLRRTQSEGSNLDNNFQNDPATATADGNLSDNRSTSIDAMF
ncbi:PREDICTED: uncharacterized protein LOC109479054 [Branchiostoma belcheri]|uniref:Uncharacterized protein LOC109479054 n=1 Tax=Branchiostoma belcheri TaxID=7741 RepID=A0A6P4ZIC5_BRABE|nr:PREDICTED: uncharacterized protein LOC109479054 [Branchiostoma belcheri]